MSRKSIAQKKQESVERIRSHARDISRLGAIKELMWRDPLGKQLTNCLVQLYLGYAESTTPQALKKYGVGTGGLPVIQQLYGNRPLGDCRCTLENDLDSACNMLCHKYGISSLLLPEDIAIEEIKIDIIRALVDESDIASPQALDAEKFSDFRHQFITTFSDWAKRCWSPRTGYGTLKQHKNWIRKGTAQLIITANSAYYTTIEEQSPPPGMPPVLTMTVDMSKVTSWDLERLAWEFKQIVKNALRSLPRRYLVDPQKTLQALSHTLHWSQTIPSLPSLPTLAVTLDCSQVNQWCLARLTKKFKSIISITLTSLPADASDTSPEADFVRKPFRWDLFQRDLRRYDWHDEYGLSYRAIAFLEQQVQHKVQKEGCELVEPLALPSGRLPRIGRPIPGEDSVEHGVKRIRDVVSWPGQVSPTQPKSSTTDTDVYHCPLHHECPENCPTLRQWQREFERRHPLQASREKLLRNPDAVHRLRTPISTYDDEEAE